MKTQFIFNTNILENKSKSEALDYLTKLGDNLFTADHLGKTILMYACEYSKEQEVINYILMQYEKAEKGDLITKKCIFGHNAFTYVCSRRESDQAILKLLSPYFLNVNNNESNINGFLWASIFVGNLEGLKFILDTTVPENNYTSTSVLELGIESGNIDILKVILTSRTWERNQINEAAKKLTAAGSLNFYQEEPKGIANFVLQVIELLNISPHVLDQEIQDKIGTNSIKELESLVSYTQNLTYIVMEEIFQRKVIESVQSITTVAKLFGDFVLGSEDKEKIDSFCFKFKDYSLETYNHLKLLFEDFIIPDYIHQDDEVYISGDDTSVSSDYIT
ncbi:hypothetical protein Trichorick_01845 (plasmid) [Candidatus Trichorickettsia mobilis]|uniref:hypothetical protein n=1 Tax=Candidatus Trichorickettsia mobilis TaxID=1346319 RepID=UPI002B260EA9|nr:hypothetical protein [Candidatus Trichorickettsia mobilis]WPY01921.1 hypothetical protein Trichorick_01845 [Candidatus Trichorickettsia mobilis]